MAQVDGPVGSAVRGIQQSEVRRRYQVDGPGIGLVVDVVLWDPYQKTCTVGGSCQNLTGLVAWLLADKQE